MIKKALSAVFGTRHDRERKRVAPIIAEINEHGERIKQISEDELRRQTEKFRGIVRERTQDFEKKIAALKELKRVTAGAAEREAIDEQLGGKDGRGGLESQLRDVIRDALD